MKRSIPGKVSLRNSKVLHCWMLAVSCCFLSCASSNAPHAPVLSGSIAGRLYLVDSNGLFDSFGAFVSIPSLPRTTMTDSLGRWTLDDLPIGTYDILATKVGYGTMKWFGQHVTGPGTYYELSSTIWPVPRGVVTLDSVITSGSSNTSTMVFGHIGGFSSICYLHVCFDADSNTRSDAPHLVQCWVGTEIQRQGSWSFTLRPEAAQGLVSGTRVYLSVFLDAGSAVGDNSYYDPASHQLIPIAPGGKSNSLLFTIP